MDDEEYELARPDPSDMDDEDLELVHPKPSELPPLQRIWKSPPEEESAVEAVPSTKKANRPGGEARVAPRAEKPRKKKKVEEEEVIDDGTGAIKLEATPVLDTYETRQRIRWVAGGILVAIALIVGGIVLSAFKNNNPIEESRDPDPNVPRGSVADRDRLEREARILLDMAKDADRNGKIKVALEQLSKLTRKYVGTAAAREATAALDRNKQGLSLFGEDEPTLAIEATPPPPGIGTAPGPTAPNNAAAPKANPGMVRAPEAPAPVAVAPPPVHIPTKPLPTGYRPNFDRPIDAAGWPTRIICDRDGAELVLVQPATFVMGRADGEPAERPPHEVELSTYYIDLHEVTVGQYVRFLKDSGRSLDPTKLVPPGVQVADDLPVVNVTYNEANAYCDWARRHLPTEAQWELAARGAEGRISYWNEVLPRPDPEKGDRPMETVMSLPADLSPYGAFDMGANAWEWTADFYDSRYYRQFRNRVKDPAGPKESPARDGLPTATVRGGSSKGILTWRKGQKLAVKLPYVGFRGALQVVKPPPPAVVAPAPNIGPGGIPGGGAVPPL